MIRSKKIVSLLLAITLFVGPVVNAGIMTAFAEEEDTLTDGTYSVQTISYSGDYDSSTEYNNAKHVDPVVLVVENGVINAYITSTGTGDYDNISFGDDQDWEQIEQGTSIGFRYKVILDELTTPINVWYGSASQPTRYSYWFLLDLDTMDVYDDSTSEADYDNEEEDEDYKYTFSYTHTIGVQAQDESGNPSSAVTLQSQAYLDISEDKIVAHIVSSGRQLWFMDQDNEEQISEMVLEEDGTRTYRFELRGDVSVLENAVPTRFAAGSSSNGYALCYTVFDFDALILVENEASENEVENGTAENEDEDEDAFTPTHTIEIELVDSNGAEHTLNQYAVNTAQIQVSGDTITARIFAGNRELTFKDDDGNTISQVIDIDDAGVRTYEMVLPGGITALSYKVLFEFPAGSAATGTSTGYLSFLTETLASIDDDTNNTDDVDTDFDTTDLEETFTATHTIEIELAYSNGAEHTLNQYAVNTAQIQVSGDTITARIFAGNRELTFKDDDGNTISQVIDIDDAGVRTYEMVLPGGSDALSYNVLFEFPAGSAATGTSTGYLVFLTETLTPINDDTKIVEPQKEEFVPTHTIEVQAQNEDGSVNARNTDITSPAEVMFTENAIIVYLSVVGRELQFQQSDGTFANEIVYEEEIEAAAGSYYGSTDTLRIYRLEFSGSESNLSALGDRIYTRFSAGSSNSGYSYYYLAFLTSTLTYIDDESEPVSSEPVESVDEPVDPVFAKFNIEVEGQNEDGTLNEQRSQYLDSKAVVEVSEGIISVYVSASERELFFENSDGDFSNNVVSYEDGIRTYMIDLNSPSDIRYDRIRTTFSVSGDNPNYDSSTPYFYLAFTARDETWELIQGVFDGTIDPSSITYSDDDDNDDESDKDTSSNGNSPTTGDASRVLFFTTILAAGGVVAGIMNQKKKKA